MKLVVLGSGTSVPHKDRSSSANWVETDGGSLLLDCSASSVHRMAQEGLDWVNLDAVWISHFHLDHAGGLAPFLFGTKWAPQTQSRTKPLRILGAVGLKAWFEAVDCASNYRLAEQPFPIEIVEVEPLKEFEILEGLTGVSFDTPHNVESRAIHVRDSNDKTLVFSADTGLSKALGAFARGVDLFLLECSFFREKPYEKHLNLEEAVYLARYSKAKKVVLTHLYPEWDEVDFEAEIGLLEPGVDIELAYDGMEIII